MRFALLRRDYALYMLPFVWGLGMLQGYVIGRAASGDCLQGYTPDRIPPEKTFFVWFLVQSVMACFYWFGIARLFEIASPFRMTLPIAAREIWMTRMGTMLVSILGGALLYSVFFALAYEPPLHPIQITLAFNAIAFIVLMPFLYRCLRVRCGGRGMPVLLYAPLLLGLIWLFTVIGLRTVLPGVISLSLAAVLGLITWLRLPQGFELSVRGSGLGRLPGLPDGLDRLPLLGRFIRLERAIGTRAWLSRPQLILVLGITAGLGVLACYRSPFGVLVLLVIVQFALFGRGLNGALHLAHLPIRYERIFHHAALPGLVGPGLLALLIASASSGSDWPAILSSKPLAVGFLIYTLLWKFSLSLVPARQSAPRLESSGWLRDRCTIHDLAIVVLLILIAGVEIYRGFEAESAGGASTLDVVGGLVPVEAPWLWGTGVIVMVIFYFALRREVLGTERAPATGGLQS